MHGLPQFLVLLQQPEVTAHALALNEFKDEVWWFQQHVKLPSWYATVTKLFLHMPSSAGVERVFSIHKK